METSSKNWLFPGGGGNSVIFHCMEDGYDDQYNTVNLQDQNFHHHMNCICMHSSWLISRLTEQELIGYSTHEISYWALAQTSNEHDYLPFSAFVTARFWILASTTKGSGSSLQPLGCIHKLHTWMTGFYLVSSEYLHIPSQKASTQNTRH